jgi:hypothetical protein
VSAWTPVLDTLERQLHRQEDAFRGSGEVPNGVLLDRPEEVMTPSEEIRAIDLVLRHDALITDTLAVMKRGRAKAGSPYS